MTKIQIVNKIISMSITSDFKANYLKKITHFQLLQKLHKDWLIVKLMK